MVLGAHTIALRWIGTVLAVLYLVLALASTSLFILVNTGIVSEEQLVHKLHRSYVLLTIILIILFIGFLTSIMTSVQTDKRSFLLPWLVFHLLLILSLVIGGTALSLHFIINKKQLTRASFYTIPILTGFMLMFFWMKVYQAMFLIKTREKKINAMKMHDLYKSTYFPFNSNLVNYPMPIHALPHRLNIYSQPNAALKETEKMKEKLVAHEYRNTEPVEEEESCHSITLVKTVKDKFSPPVYFFGDPLGFLTWRNRCRNFETLEASIVFDAEEEEWVYDTLPKGLMKTNLEMNRKEIGDARPKLKEE